jgi:hypothetical protein
VGRVALIAAVCLGVALVAAGCGSTRLDPHKMQDAIAHGVERDLHFKPRSVHCPANIPARAGYVFHCDVVSAAGGRARARVQEQDARGNVVFRVPG